MSEHWAELVLLLVNQFFSLLILQHQCMYMFTLYAKKEKEKEKHNKMNKKGRRKAVFSGTKLCRLQSWRTDRTSVAHHEGEYTWTEGGTGSAAQGTRQPSGTV